MQRESYAVKPWRVLHACDRVNAVAATAETQSAVGMCPQLLSREAWGETQSQPSPITAWSEVRNWRRALNEAEATNSFEIVHAYSFASAMAGVRGSLPLVYDFQWPLEEIGAEQAQPGPWLLRSLRVAEQFALSRAGAVVTHSEEMKAAAHQRGAAMENIFLVAGGTESPEAIGRCYDGIYRHAYARRSEPSPRYPTPRIYALGRT
jgi:hypothetical protein